LFLSKRKGYSDEVFKIEQGAEGIQGSERCGNPGCEQYFQGLSSSISSDF
jgi:hypothetical protein